MTAVDVAAVQIAAAAIVEGWKQASITPDEKRCAGAVDAALTSLVAYLAKGVSA